MYPEIPTVDPDAIAETLCIGRVNLSAGPGPLATITFTNIRSQAGPLIDNNRIVQECVVRARIVTTIDNLTALRDLLIQAIPVPGQPAATDPGSAGSANELN
jgi:hypothetical protein